ncbi:hypothetical protein [Sphingomonas sp.]|uniref:hypothetical protein n=1 Tax=Sphingomonas sp. TaxID=28214 RepID=UPI00286D9F68|nr:hypothetical protein [Sphingomonas sp.]
MHKVRIFGVFLLFSAGACSSEPEDVAQTWRDGRDGLCLVGEAGALRAGLIAYGAGDANCSLAGKADRAGDKLTITPQGDTNCRVEVAITGEQARLGPLSEACSYYCGPGANFSNRVLQPAADTPAKITDLAGDSLC